MPNSPLESASSVVEKAQGLAQKVLLAAEEPLVSSL